jgi:hypothetical protein
MGGTHFSAAVGAPISTDSSPKYMAVDGRLERKRKAITEIDPPLVALDVNFFP